MGFTVLGVGFGAWVSGSGLGFRDLGYAFGCPRMGSSVEVKKSEPHKGMKKASFPSLKVFEASRC